MKFLSLDPNIQTEVESFTAPAERILSGNPTQKVWPHYSNQSNEFHSGVWQADVGKWQVSFSEDEYCFILEGESVVTDAEGIANTVKAGDHFVIPAGFSGTWEVVKPTRKVYVCYEKVS